ncbi:aminomethyltransferase family protein [Streptomyces sp. NPDC088116]|uniref:aminomethyltransferase family protein n=1 Tax=Streptomyces sp. NPDC088116 TaxID=3365825 RepID=UPI00382B9496
MTSPEGLLATPFSSRFEDRVEQWADAFGCAVPVELDGAAQEYEAIRTTAGASDYSVLYKWHVEGPDAVAVVDALFSRDLSALPPGRLMYGVVVTAEGAMLDDVTVVVLGPGHVVITGGNPALREQLAARLPARTTLTERREDVAVLSLQGPRSREILQRLTEQDISREAFPYYTLREDVPLAGISARVSRVGFTAELGYEVEVDREHAPALWDAVFEAGADFGMRAFGMAALMMCRIEAGMIMAELDYDRTVTPFECRMGWTVDLGKASFQGRDALLAKKGTVRDRLVSVVVDAGPEAAEGARLELGGRDIGRLNMTVPSPHLGGATLGLARIDLDAAKADSALTAVTTTGARVAATVRTTPVYDPERVRVRA